MAFIGNSGGGKSTVMKILFGFYYPQAGQYRIYGHDECTAQTYQSGVPECVFVPRNDCPECGVW